MKKIEDWWYTSLAADNSKGAYKYPQLKKLFALGIIPTLKRDGEKRRWVRPWILEAHTNGYNVRKIPADISKEDFQKLLPTLRRG